MRWRFITRRSTFFEACPYLSLKLLLHFGELGTNDRNETSLFLSPLTVPSVVSIPLFALSRPLMPFRFVVLFQVHASCV